MSVPKIGRDSNHETDDGWRSRQELPGTDAGPPGPGYGVGACVTLPLSLACSAELTGVESGGLPSINEVAVP